MLFCSHQDLGCLNVDHSVPYAEVNANFLSLLCWYIYSISCTKHHSLVGIDNISDYFKLNFSEMIAW